jgi:sorting nexin-13
MQVLWPDGIFITKHPRNLTPTSAAALEDLEIVFPYESQDPGQQPPPMSSFDQRCEAARRAGVVREIILGMCFSLSIKSRSACSIRACYYV